MHNRRNVATNRSQSSFINVVLNLERVLTKNYIADPCDQLITTIKGGGPKCVATLMISMNMHTSTLAKSTPMSTSMMQSISTDTSAAIDAGIIFTEVSFSEEEAGH